jgi:DTW domain-containing protein
MDEKKLQRKRKTKNPCPECFLHLDNCICSLIPCLDLKTKVLLLVHAKELKRTTNTGRLAVKALKNSEMIIRGLDHERLDLTSRLTSNYQSLLFYPSADASELTKEFLNQFDRPIQLLVPDGNWRQASKVHFRHPELKGIPRVKISKANESLFHLRAEATEEGMATLEAIAEALKIIEGEAVFKSLNDLYQAKLKATLKGRGQLI